MRKAKIYRYCLPMDSGVILRDNKLTERKGYILELTDGDKVGRGEVAPLVGFSSKIQRKRAFSCKRKQSAGWQTCL